MRSLCSLAEREGEVEDEQYPFGEAPTEDDVCVYTYVQLSYTILICINVIIILMQYKVHNNIIMLGVIIHQRDINYCVYIHITYLAYWRIL